MAKVVRLDEDMYNMLKKLQEGYKKKYGIHLSLTQASKLIMRRDIEL